MRRPLAVALAAALTACASTKTRPLDRSRPIEIEERWSGTTFKQEGVRLDDVELMSALVATPAGRDHVRSGTRSGVTSLGMLAAGVGMFVGALVVDDRSVGTGLSIGAVAACGGSLYLQHRAQSSFTAAAREFNASLPAATSTRAAPPRAAGPTLSLTLAF